MPSQPTGMTVDKAVNLTCGCFVNGEAWELVGAFATNSSAIDLYNMCEDAVKGFEATMIPLLLEILSADGYVAFVSAVGIARGSIPWRDSFASTDYPGAITSAALPTNVAALGVIYEDPADVPTGKKIASAKSFFAGLGESQVTGNNCNDGLVLAINNFLIQAQSGYPSVADSGSSWYRVIKPPQPITLGLHVRRTFQPEARGYICTQKRRLVPRA